MAGIDHQRAWKDRYAWRLDGDEWSGMAAFCGQPYEAWKRALIAAFIDEHMADGARVVEIAAGHGRWTEHLLRRAGHVTIVEVDQDCLDACVERFAGTDNLATYLTDGWAVPVVPDRSVDFIWSFDSMVHMPPEVVRGYLGEIARTLRPGGIAVLHHAGLSHWSLPLAHLTKYAGRPGRAIQRLAGQGRLRHGGSRSAVSRQSMHKWVTDAGLVVEAQTQAWGDEHQFDVRRFGDWITVMRQPH